MKEFDPVEEVIEAVRGGKIVVVMDDEDRENEGDVICAAEFATPENVNFMASYAKGLICMPMHVDYVEKLGLDMMCSVNTDNHGTAFTESIDYKDILRDHGDRNNLIAQLNKLLRHFEVVRELLHLLYGQRAEAVIRQGNYHECSGNNVVDVTVLIPQSAVQRQTFQLAFLVAD